MIKPLATIWYPSFPFDAGKFVELLTLRQDGGCWRNSPFLKVLMPCLLPTDYLRQRTCRRDRETPPGFGLSFRGSFSWLNFCLFSHHFVPDCWRHVAKLLCHLEKWLIWRTWMEGHRWKSGTRMGTWSLNTTFLGGQNPIHQIPTSEKPFRHLTTALTTSSMV